MSCSINGKYSPDIEDVKAVAKPILRHRVIKNYKAESEGISIDQIIENIIMILPIVSFGNSILRGKCRRVDENQPIDDILNNMYDTMYNAQGVGLAAPQVGLDLSIFIIDTTLYDDENNLTPIKKEFINPEIIDYSGKDESFNEGCLSIPGLREDVIRKDQSKLNTLTKILMNILRDMKE